eukprot:Gb_14425 [translate_table: standard]
MLSSVAPPSSYSCILAGLAIVAESSPTPGLRVALNYQLHAKTVSAVKSLVARSRGLCVHSLGVHRAAMDSLSSEDRSARQSVDCASSTVSIDVSGDGTSSETLSFGIGEAHYDHTHGDEIPSCSEGSSPFGWSLGRTETPNPVISTIPLATAGGRDSVLWEEKREKQETNLSAFKEFYCFLLTEVEMMKERFSKLLLGEDMSGGGKGVCTALAISNAITNLSATIFGQLWRLEPLAAEKKLMWRREMEWFLCVSDYIVELIPACQNFPDGSSLEVMVSRPRSDLYINLPALRKLDTMLLEALDSFRDTEFWYVDQGVLAPDTDGCGQLRRPPQRQEDKWWLPIPRVPPCGLSDNARKCLQHQRECTNQILKAAIAINSNILSEMEVPEIYMEALPKNGKASLGDIIYRYITAEQFSPDCLLDCLDLSSEHHTLEIANRIEAAIHVWRRKLHGKYAHNVKENKSSTKSSWGIVKDFMVDVEKRELLADRAESLLLSLKQRFPGLSQTVLDMSKIQYNKSKMLAETFVTIEQALLRHLTNFLRADPACHSDGLSLQDVGQSILESYSRVLESLAFNIIARIDDLLYVDDLTKNSDSNQCSSIPLSVSSRGVIAPKRVSMPFSVPPSSNTPYATAFATPNFSPTPLVSPGRTTKSTFVSGKANAHSFTPVNKVLSDYLGGEIKSTDGNTKESARLALPVSKEMGKYWSYTENLGSRKDLISPPTRD